MGEIKYEDLQVDTSKIPVFSFTDEIESSGNFLGQERAKRAFELGLRISKKGYNIFVVGPTGTGRRTFVLKELDRVAKNEETPPDWVYAYNFEDSRTPIAMSMKAGTGKKLKRDMERLVDDILEAISKAFEGEEYTAKRAQVEDEYTRMKNELWEKLREQARELGFNVQITPTGVLTVPVIDGKPITSEMYDLLPEEKKKEIEENSMKMKHLVEGTIYRSRKLDREMKEKLEEIDRQVALFAIGGLFDDLKARYRENEGILAFLDRVKEDVLENLNSLRQAGDDEKEYYKRRYSVNLIVDNSELNGAPVVYERNPTYSNLFGKIEYFARMGILQTDFTMIKAGAVHRSNGGYLVIDAENLLRNIHSWEGLKRVLMSSQVKVENLESVLGFSSTMTLSPEPIPVDVKVILIGTPFIYHILYELDEDFRKLFKVKVEFDWSMDYTEESVMEFLGFVENHRKDSNLIKISKEAFERLVWYSNRLAGSRKKLSTRLGKVADLLVEADHIAREKGEESMNCEDIDEAFEKMEERVRLLQDKYDEMIRKRDLLIETEGKAIGQVNGLTVLDLGDHSFGVPVKITVKAFLGKSGVIDIQRESDLSGKIHGKAVLILEGFFGSRYSRRFPMSLTASISFEQVYSEVEGDSASLAETLALISAISEIPVRQDIAITGSINQNGEVQPVGGVTEKVEGFYRACKLRGFTGTQGVIIPRSNLENLVLRREILQTIKDGKFHVWCVENVDEAIEISMGRKAGEMTRTGRYPRGTVNYAVLKKLEEARNILEGKEKKRKKKKK